MFAMPLPALLLACSLEKREGAPSGKEKGLVMGSVSSHQVCRVIKGGVLGKFLDLFFFKQV